MSNPAVLSQVLLGYSPMIDRQRNVVATRLTVFPDKPDAAPDADALLGVLNDVWPPEADDAALSLKLNPRPLDPGAVRQRPPQARPPLSLNLAGEALLHRVMATGGGAHLMIEVPAFMAGDPAHVPALRDMHGAGTTLLIKGRPIAPLAPDVLGLFSHSIVDAGDDRRTAAAPAPGVRSVTTVQAGARTSAQIDGAFQRGAVAVLGWPLDDDPPRPAPRGSVASDVGAVMELIQGVDQQLPVPRLEAVLRRDPTLAFRLLRYLNSPAFGLSVEITSFGHALMMLGYQRLKRWLALLLASSGKGTNAKPMMYAAVRRGLLMEQLCRDSSDAELRGEMFICGVFSLLDRLLQQPFSQLLDNMPLPERVQQALREGKGPFAPYLDLVRAIEQESLFDIRQHADTLLLAPADVNAAVLGAMRSARQLDG